MGEARPKIKAAGLFVLAAATLFCGFQWNLFGVAEAGWFRTHQRDSEAMILARLAVSRKQGILAAGGLPVTVANDDLVGPKIDLPQQYEAYLDGRSYDYYWPYCSQIGGQGIALGLLDRWIDAPTYAKLELFHGLTSLASALVLASIIVWLYLELGLAAAVVALASTVLAPWLMVFGRNLWWCLWSFYLPMAAVMFALRSRPQPAGRGLWLLGAVVFATVLIKCLFSGYEYITTALVMVLVPLAYYAISRRMRPAAALRAAGACLAGMAGAILLSAAVLCVQISYATGDAWAGPKHIHYSLLKRTFAPSYAGGEELAESHDASVAGVLWVYVAGAYSDLPSDAGGPQKPAWPVRYGHLIILFTAAGAALWAMGRRAGPERRGRDLGLIAACAVALLAPLSWMVVFKAHSFVHVHMNFVTWHLPYTLLGFALVGVTLARLWSAWREKPEGGQVPN